jgi:hypothetical protein
MYFIKLLPNRVEGCQNYASTPLNYRPISLLDSFAKLFEKILLKRFNHKLKELNVIREDQYGFKKGHSTTHALVRLIERITHGFNNNKATLALFLDIKRAFDKVWITGLICKLITARIPAHFVQIIHSYLKNRHFTAVHGNSESSRRPVLARVPQHSLLGAIFFIIYMNDIPSIQNDNNVAMSLDADDTNVTVRSGSRKMATDKLNSTIKMLHSWFKNRELRLTLVNAPSYSFPNG